MDIKNWYLIDRAEELDSPALVLYPGRVRENIRTLTGMIDRIDRLRPHVKTHKTREATLMMIEAGIKKFKCATIAEAEMLAMCEAPDVLLAYQPVGPRLDRFIKLIRRYPDTCFSCLVDHEAAALAISAAAGEQGLILTVYLDLNVGMNRTGIRPDDQAFALYKTCVSLEGLNLAGLHAYDGHIHDASFEIRVQKSREAIDPVLKLQREITAAGYDRPVIIAGGTPTFPIYAGYENIECSPGTFIFWDKGYGDAFKEQAFLPAALVITRIVSLPDKTKICVDLGHKSVASENELARRIFFLNAPGLKPVSQSEEHLVLEAAEDHQYHIGDVLYGLPVHICPTCALYERAFTIENGRVSGEWKIIARDRKITI